MRKTSTGSQSSVRHAFGGGGVNLNNINNMGRSPGGHGHGHSHSPGHARGQNGDSRGHNNSHGHSNGHGHNNGHGHAAVSTVKVVHATGDRRLSESARAKAGPLRNPSARGVIVTSSITTVTTSSSGVTNPNSSGMNPISSANISADMTNPSTRGRSPSSRFLNNNPGNGSGSEHATLPSGRTSEHDRRSTRPPQTQLLLSLERPPSSSSITVGDVDMGQAGGGGGGGGGGGTIYLLNLYIFSLIAYLLAQSY